MAQLRSATGTELVREVQNYMASYQGAGDSSVDLGRTMQMLKMSRKGYQVQADKKKKENQREKEKLAQTIQYLQEEMSALEEKEQSISGQSEVLLEGGEGVSLNTLEGNIEELCAQKNKLGFFMAAAFSSGDRRRFGCGRRAEKPFSCNGYWYHGNSSAAGLYVIRLRLNEKIENRKRQRETSCFKNG